VESTLESVVDNAYVYGRDWISQQVIVSDIAIFVLKRDVKHQLTN